MNKLVKLVTLSVLALMLPACLSELMLRLDTEQFTAEASANLAKSDEAFDQLIKSDRELWSVLYQLDQDCLPPDLGPVFLYVDVQDEKEWCTASQAPGTHKLEAGLTFQTLQTQKQLVVASISYVKALTNAVARKSKRAEHFAQAHGDLELISTALGKSNPINAKQATAVKGLLEFLTELERDAASAKAILAILKQKGPTAAAHFDALRSELEGTEAYTESNLIAVRNLALVGMKLGENDSFLRSRLLDAYHSADDRTRSTALKRAECLKRAESAGSDGQAETERQAARDAAAYECRNPMAALVGVTLETHRELLNLSSGEYSEEQRARLAHLAFRRFLSAVRMLVDLRAAI